MSVRTRRLLAALLLPAALLAGCAGTGDDRDGGDDAIGGAGVAPNQQQGDPVDPGESDEQGS